MTEQPSPPAAKRALTREERLAAKLRENLRCRKEQSRALASELPHEDGLAKDSPTG